MESVDLFLEVGGGGLRDWDHDQVAKVMAEVRRAARLVDMPPNELTSSAFVEEALAVCRAHPALSAPVVITGEELRAQGLGLLHSVGQGSVCPPSLVAVELPADSPGGLTVALVGKGIVFDTGGLQIKTKDGMPGMKGDMGGAAAVLGAMACLAARGGRKHRVIGVLCISENSVSDRATRPDDIIKGHSGKTVEINNTDAEGRLVLADGVSWVTASYKVDVVIDIATLTGAQGIATGQRMAAIMSSDEELESLARRAGLQSGDLTFPIPFCPEFFLPEFDSAVADMKNSVKNRSNAQSSCAGAFIGHHLPEGWLESNKWLHIDCASPAHKGDRATGYGVALLTTIVSSL